MHLLLPVIFFCLIGTSSAAECTDNEEKSITDAYAAAAATSACSPWSSSNLMILIVPPCSATDCVAVMEDLAGSIPNCTTSGLSTSEKDQLIRSLDICATPAPTPASTASSTNCSSSEAEATFNAFYEAANGSCASSTTFEHYSIIIDTPCTSACAATVRDFAQSLPNCKYQLSSHRDLLPAIGQPFHSSGKVFSVHPHPRVSRLICLREGICRRLPRRKWYKGIIMTATIRRGQCSVQKRAQKWRMACPIAAASLTRLEWNRLKRIVGLTPWGEQILFRLKHQAFSLYDPLSGLRGCPHTSCVRVSKITLTHVFWTCPAATALRRVLTTQWRQDKLPEAQTKQAIFSLSLTTIPGFFGAAADELFPLLPHQDRVRLTEGLDAAADSCWRLAAALYFQGVWRWRVSHFDPHNDVSEGFHTASLSTRLRHGYKTIPFRMPARISHKVASQVSTVLHTVFRAATASRPLAIAPRNGYVLLLFFDGGSRGNPGPGGSGSVIVKTELHGPGLEVLWLSSMSFAAARTTNNIAENMGLLLGLKACNRHGWSQIHVIGDSQLIVRQQATRTVPKTKHLKPLFWQIRRQADKVGILGWHHHPRAYNKMADSLANLAMDSRKSTQLRPSWLVSSTTTWDVVYTHATNDVGHWKEDNHYENSSELAAFQV